MTDRESAQVKVAETPDPPWDGAGYGQSASGQTLFRMHPVDSRQLRGSRDVVYPGTGELLYHVASLEDATMPAGGQEDGGSVGAACQCVMRWTWCRSAREGKPERKATVVSGLQ
jgi:hypothetical protein